MSADSTYSRSHHFQNWAKTFECYPERFYQPDSLNELKDIIGEAHKKQKQVKVVGSGHSPSDIHCTTSWMINLDKLNRVLSVNPEQMEIEIEAGIRIYELNAQLEKRGWAITNFGSISEQSIAGAISTGTHGSSLKHGILSSQVTELTLLLANGSEITCSRVINQDIFQAACLNLGALGIITSVKMKCLKSFDLKCTMQVETFENFLSLWKTNQLWETSEYIRVSWFPYARRVVINQQESVPPNPKMHFKMTPLVWLKERFLGFYVNEMALAIGKFQKKLLPFFEKLIFYGKFGAKTGVKMEKIEPSYKGFPIDCLYSQWVDEWAIPIDKGPEALLELEKFFHKDPSCIIPFPSEKIYVHSPIEIRVVKCDNSAFLSQAYGQNVVYIGVIMYRPYHMNTEHEEYFRAYEWLMEKLGGRPHWAKRHSLPKEELRKRYPKFDKWFEIRQKLDPDGMFLGEYLQRHVV